MLNEVKHLAAAPQQDSLCSWRLCGEFRRVSGFTLIELLVAISLLAVVMAIVYASFSSVVNSTDTVRSGMDELRLRQFLTRNFTRNFAAACSAYSVPVAAEYAEEQFMFIGIDDEDAEGPMDAVEFVSTAPLMGGMALPGDLKEVRYEVVAEEHAGMGIDMDGDEDENAPMRFIESVETPLLAGNLDMASGDSDSNTTSAVKPATETANMVETPTWSVPVRTMDLWYFDGEEWVSEWDSTLEGRLPWYVQIRINFARTESQLEEEQEEGINTDEDPDFELIVPIPAGIGSVKKTDDAPDADDEDRTRSQ